MYLTVKKSVHNLSAFPVLDKLIYVIAAAMILTQPFIVYRIWNYLVFTVFSGKRSGQVVTSHANQYQKSDNVAAFAKNQLHKLLRCHLLILYFFRFRIVRAKSIDCDLFDFLILIRSILHVTRCIGNFIYYIHTFQHFAERGILTIKMR